MINNGSLCYLSMLTDATPLQPTYLTISLRCSVQSSGRYSHKFPTRLSPAGSSLSVFPMLLFPICAFLYHISASIQIQNLFVKEFITILFIFHQLKALMYSPWNPVHKEYMSFVLFIFQLAEIKVLCLKCCRSHKEFVIEILCLKSRECSLCAMIHIVTEHFHGSHGSVQ